MLYQQSERPPSLVEEKAPLIQKDDSISVPRWNFLICFFVNFTVQIGFSVIIPSLWPYIHASEGNRTFLGLAFASFSVGQLIGAPVLGSLSDHVNLKLLICLSILLDIASQCVYATALLHKYGTYTILIARFVSGFAAGNLAILQGYISATTTPKTRSKHMGRLMTALSAAYITGPAIGALLSLVDFSIWSVSVNATTAPAWLNALLLLLALLLLIIFFKSHSIPKHEHAVDEQSSTHSTLRRSQEGNLNNKYTALLSPAAATPINEEVSVTPTSQRSIDDLSLPPPDKPDLLVTPPRSRSLYIIRAPRLWAVCALCVCNLLVFNGLIVYETICTPLTMSSFGWSETENGVLWACIGVVSAAAFLLLGFISRNGENDLRLLFASAMLLCSSFATLVGDWNLGSGTLDLWRFLLGTGFLALSFPICQAELATVFSKVVGHGTQGVYFGFFTAAASFSRVAAPIWAGSVLSYEGESLVFFSCLAASALLVVLLVVLYPNIRRLVRLNMEMNDQ